MTVPCTTSALARPVVLLVDGHADSMDMYSLMLSRAGFDVDTAMDGIEAVAQLARRVPAVIALELALSGDLSGYDLCRQVRAHASTRAVPLVAVTARAFASDATRAVEAGCDVVLTKPCLPETLVSELKRLLGLPSPAPLAAAAAARGAVRTSSTSS